MAVEELLCVRHRTPLKHTDIVAGTIRDGWYCKECGTYYVSGNPSIVAMLTYECKNLACLNMEQAAIADDYLRQYEERGEFPGNEEESLGVFLVCGDCRESFLFSQSEQETFLQKRRPAPTQCPKCRDKRKKEVEKKVKYRDARQTMARLDTRPVDTKGRQVTRSGGEVRHIAEVFIPEDK